MTDGHITMLPEFDTDGDTDGEISLLSDKIKEGGMALYKGQQDEYPCTVLKIYERTADVRLIEITNPEGMGPVDYHVRLAHLVPIDRETSEDHED